MDSTETGKITCGAKCNSTTVTLKNARLRRCLSLSDAFHLWYSPPETYSDLPCFLFSNPRPLTARWSGLLTLSAREEPCLVTMVTRRITSSAVLLLCKATHTLSKHESCILSRFSTDAMWVLTGRKIQSVFDNTLFLSSCVAPGVPVTCFPLWKMRQATLVRHCIALHCIALHCIALHCIALHCIALHCIALHCMT